MIAFVQGLVKYALFEPFGVSITLNNFGFSLLVLSTLCLAAAGYIINDIYDIETDRINKPHQMIIGRGVTEKTAFNLFLLFNVVGVGLGFYLALLVGEAIFFSIFIMVSALLFLYASTLKQRPLIGNIIISLLVGIAILLVGIFELIPSITPQNRPTQLTFFKLALDYALFAFGINLIREIIKAIEDIDGDHKAGMKTLPIVIGRTRTKNIAFALLIAFILGIIYYVITYLYQQPVAVVYFLGAILAPLIYCSVALFSAKSKQQFHYLSKVLKLVMITGILSILLYKFILI